MFGILLEVQRAVWRECNFTYFAHFLFWMAENRERHSESSDWMKTVPSYNQTNSSMDFRNYMMRDENLEPLPKNWEMAYTDTGMIYFIE